MEENFGRRACGVATRVLLGPGIPLSESLNALTRSIEEQLSDTNRQVEESVMALLALSQSLSDNGKNTTDTPDSLPSLVPTMRFIEPADALRNVKESRLLEKTACCKPDSHYINRYLSKLLQLLDAERGNCEEAVLRSLLNLSSTQGVSLPGGGTSQTEPLGVSALSLNAVTDSSGDTETQSLWAQICSRLRQYYVAQLSALSQQTDSEPGSLDLIGARRLAYVQSMCSLSSRADVWTKYRLLRMQQFNTHARAQARVSGAESALDQFESLAGAAITMMTEDLQLVSSGVFGGAVGAQDALAQLYLEPLTEELTSLIEVLLQAAQAPPSNDKKSKNSSTVSNGLTLPKSRSDSSSIRRSLRKHDSQSVHSLLGFEAGFTDLHSIPTGALGLQVRLVNCIASVEEHLRSLHSMIMWQVTSHKPAPRRLKSALKSRESRRGGEPLLMRALAGAAAILDSDDVTHFSNARAMTAELTNTYTVVEREAYTGEVWAWRPLFSRLSGNIAYGIEQHVRQALQQMHATHKEQLDAKRSLEMVALPEVLTGGRLDYPARVSKPLLGLFMELDWLLPLAAALGSGTGGAGGGHLVHAAFVESTSQAVNSLLSFFKQTESEIGDKYPPSLRHQLLACLAFTRNQLYVYDVTLAGNQPGSERPLQSVYRETCARTEQVAAMLEQVHAHVLCGAVLHDADSGNWAHSKDFFEDERCGLGVQMFLFHTRRLRARLWEHGPAKRAQIAYTRTVRVGLELLSRRYARTTPSYRRTKLLKLDMMTLLRGTCELLLDGAVCHIGHLLDATPEGAVAGVGAAGPTDAAAEVYAIHVACCNLLALLAVLCAPIDTLYKLFKKGLSRRSRRSIEEGTARETLYVTHWLSWIHPKIFPVGARRLEDLQTTTALYLQLRILYAQPEPVYWMLMQNLLMKDYTLSILIVTHAAKLHNSIATPGNQLDSYTNQVGNQTSSPSNDTECEVYGLLSDMTHVFLSLSSFPAALAEIFVPVFERTDSWSCFDESVVIGRDLPVLPWVQCILDCFEPLIRRAVEPGLSVLLERELSAPADPAADLDELLQLQQLPCGCEASPSGLAKAAALSPKGGHKEPLAEAVYSVLTQLVCDVSCVATPLAVLCRTLHDCVTSRGINPAHDCLAMQLLAASVRRHLLDSDWLTGLVGAKLSRDDYTRDLATALGDVMYHVLTASNFSKGSGVPRVATRFIKANRSWLSEQIKVLKRRFNDPSLDQPPCHPLRGQTPEYTCTFLTAFTASLQTQAGGPERLSRLYHMVRNNLPWLYAQLDAPTLYAQLDVARRPKTVPTADASERPGVATVEGEESAHFRIDTENRLAEAGPFNPLREYNRLSEHMDLDMNELRDFEVDWAAMLQCNLGLSEAGFRALLTHRFEFQPGAQLTEAERKPVEALRRRFDLEPSELV